MCAEKAAYFAKESVRRHKENLVIDVALNIFNTKLSKLSLRVRERASSINLTGKLSGKFDLAHRVVKSRKGVEGGLAGRVKERAAVVF